MPIREFACRPCRTYKEFYHPSVDPEKVPVPDCPKCNAGMERLMSIPNIDTSSTFHPFDWHNPDTGKMQRISNLHEIRQIEHASLATGRNIRFDVYSAEPSNPDPIDGFGLPYWDGTPEHTAKKAFSKE